MTLNSDEHTSLLLFVKNLVCKLDSLFSSQTREDERYNGGLSRSVQRGQLSFYLSRENQVANYNYDPRDIPTYSSNEASHYLGIPVATIRSWIYGRSYKTKQGTQRFSPLIKLPSSQVKQLSFTNLVEAHVLRAIRTIHGISMDKVRIALDYLEQKLDYRTPLVRAEFKTDGVDLFVNHLGQLVPASAPSLESLHKDLMLHLERIDTDESNLASRLFPFGIKSSYPSNLSIPKSVVIDPRISFGRAVLLGTGIPTAILAERFKFGESFSELAEDYGCSLQLIEEGIRWEISVAA